MCDPNDDTENLKHAQPGEEPREKQKTVAETKKKGKENEEKASRRHHRRKRQGKISPKSGKSKKAEKKSGEK